MIKLSVNLAARYTTFLKANGIDQGQHNFYLKWLRYYLDFCTKYSFKWSENDSLSAFLIKLKSKNQQPFMLDQAKKVVGLFWTMEKSEGTNQPNVEVPKERSAPSISNQPIKEFRRKSTLPASSKSSTNRVQPAQFEEKGKVVEKQSCADWRHVYAELENAIKMRHYSPKTLKSYIGYTRQFQAFVKSREPKLVSVEDVKGFLTFLYSVELKMN